ncbi:MAG TPA: hypothetical protein VFT50_07100 [Baekduia sp.]|nr:hypothetical protein [Baekduia sp.]
MRGGATDQQRAGGRSGLGRYLLAWLLAGAVIVAAVAVIHGRASPRPGGLATPVPPLRETSLRTAVRRAHCSLAARRQRPRPAPSAPVPRATAHDRALTSAERQTALGGGLIVIEYRRDLPLRVVDELRLLRDRVPEGTVLAPRDGRAAALLVSSARRRLRCGRASPVALDALRLFRGRYLGIRGTS